MSKIYSPKIVTDSLVMCLDASNNKSYPSDLPVKGGLLLWLDAADDSTFSYSSGTEVSQWRDKSGNNSHANQATTANQPSRSSFVNSRRGVNFTSANGDFMRVSSGIVTPNYITLFAVVRPATQDNSYAIIMEQDHGNGYNGWVIQRNNVGSFWQSWVASTASTWLNPNQIAYTDNTSQIVTLRKNASTINLYSNGTSSSPVSISDTVITQTSYGLNLGYWQYGGGRYYNGVMCEILVFNRGLSDVELRQVNTYLGQKWGISNTDRSIIDLSGFNDNGLLGNGTTANMPVYDYYNKGSLSFDGSNDYITIPSSASIKNTSSLTLEAWIYISNSMNYYGGIFGKGTTDTDEEYCLLVHSVNSKVYMDVGSSGGPYTDATFSFSLNTWYHIIGTHERAAGSSAIKIYVNGSLLSSSTVNPTTAVNDNSTAVTIGSRFSTGGSPWNGKIANAKIYTRTLSATEVAQNYETMKSKFANTIVQQGLVLNLDAGNPYSYGGAGTTVYDVSNTALSWTTNNTIYNSDPIKYFSYNGSSSWLQSSTSAAYDSQTITMECWFYPTTLTQDGFLFEKGQVNTQYSMFLAFGNTFYFRTIGGTINNQDLTFTTSTYIVANVWNHVVCTYNGSTKIVYVNGIQAASVAASGTLQTGQTNQYIGKYGAAGNNFPFNGRIAESRVYNIALSAAQVLQNYNATKGRFGL